jgi:pyridoxal phosphate enzyme (YggS family)
MSIADNLAQVRARIDRAAERAGRDPKSVTLVAVSKRHDEHAIRLAYAEGQRDFGENYVQELAQKAAALVDLTDLRWHFIGHLQRNKVRAVMATNASIQTVDSVRLGAAIAKERATLSLAAGAAGRTDVHVQVNVAAEAQKSGCSVPELPELVTSLVALPELRVVGLMTIPPADDAEAAVRCYRDLRELAERHGLPSLSMGMTDDLEVAVAEGSTLVRVGTAIFGERPL